MIELFYAKISCYIEDKKLETLSFLLEQDKRNRIFNYSIKDDKKNSLYSELFLRSKICKDLNLKNSDICFLQNKYGKPYLKSHPDYFYNISHTQNAFVVAISSKDVGVDIERVRNVDIHIAERFFTKNEIAYVTMLSYGMNERFFEVWTQKEAFTKFKGKGLTIPLNSFDVFETYISRKLKTIKTHNYIISVCNNDCNKELKFFEISEKKIEDNMISIQM